MVKTDYKICTYSFTFTFIPLPLSGNETVCDASASPSPLSNYLYVFILGQLLHGIGGTILYSLGIIFIDEHVKNDDSPFYQGELIVKGGVWKVVDKSIFYPFFY